MLAPVERKRQLVVGSIVLGYVHCRLRSGMEPNPGSGSDYIGFAVSVSQLESNTGQRRKVGPDGTMRLADHKIIHILMHIQ
jgi:hypothetical protein